MSNNKLLQSALTEDQYNFFQPINSTLNTKVNTFEINHTIQVKNIKKAMEFVVGHKKFNTEVYLIGSKHLKNTPQNMASDILPVAKLFQEDYHNNFKQSLTRTKINLTLGKVRLLDEGSFWLNFYPSIDSSFEKKPSNSLKIGDHPLLRLLFDGPREKQKNTDSNSPYITWDAAKLDTKTGLWTSKIRLLRGNKSEHILYLGFKLPEGAECLQNVFDINEKESFKS